MQRNQNEPSRKKTLLERGKKRVGFSKVSMLFSEHTGDGFLHSGWPCYVLLSALIAQTLLLEYFFIVSKTMNYPSFLSKISSVSEKAIQIFKLFEWCKAEVGKLLQ